MISKCIALLVAALVLANCCISGSGCAAPGAPGSPVAWDGLGPAPAEDTQSTAPPPNKLRSKRELAASAAEGRQNGKLQPGDNWEQQQAADRDEEMRLKRTLMICRDCTSPEPNRDDATARAAR